MKNIALVDTFWHGHHSVHFKLYTKILLEQGYQVTAFCPNPVELSEWIADNFPEKTKLLHAFEVQEPKRNQFPIARIRHTLTTLARWQQVATAIQNNSDKIGNLPDLVFFLSIDNYLAPFLTHHIVDKVFAYNWFGLYHDPFHLRVKQRLAFLRRGFLNTDAVLYSPHCLGVTVHDEGITEKLKSKINGKPVVTFPNTVDESPPAQDYSVVKQIQDKARGRKIIGLLGSQGKRKGLLTLLEVAQRSVQEDWFFVFAGGLAEGSFSTEELRKLQGIVKAEPDNCFFHFKHVPGEPQFNALVSACDVLYVVNENYPSNSQMLTLAAIFEKPVIGNETFCIGERVQKFKLGLSIPEGDVSRCIEALRCLFNEPEPIKQRLQSNFKDYQELHSTKQLHIAFQSILNAVNSSIYQLQ